MPDNILPRDLTGLLRTFRCCFTAPTFRNFVTIIGGWIHCLGRRTITGVALASGRVGERHISMFHRFFSRASWCLDSVSGALFRLAEPWLPSDEPLYVPLDDTLARKGGKCIALASIHYDPLLSTRRKPFFSYGHCWVVLSVWVPLPMGGFALPIFFRLFVGRKRGGEGNAPSRRASRKRLRAARRAFKKNKYRTKLQLAREMIAELAVLAPHRTIYVICDSAYAGRMILEKRPPNVHVISRLRMGAALYAPPPPVTRGGKGRPRRRGKRLPKPARSAACCKKWVTCRINIYSSEVETWITTRTALWYVALRDALSVTTLRDAPAPILV